MVFPPESSTFPSCGLTSTGFKFIFTFFFSHWRPSPSPSPSLFMAVNWELLVLQVGTAWLVSLFTSNLLVGEFKFRLWPTLLTFQAMEKKKKILLVATVYISIISYMSGRYRPYSYFFKRPPSQIGPGTPAAVNTPTMAADSPGGY